MKSEAEEWGEQTYAETLADLLVDAVREAGLLKVLDDLYEQAEGDLVKQGVADRLCAGAAFVVFKPGDVRRG